MLLLVLYYYFYAFLIVIVPLVFSSITGFEIPKVILIRVLSVFFLILFICLFSKKYKKIKFDKYDLMGILWILFTVCSSILGGNFYASFWGGPFRFQGILTQMCLVVLFVTTRKALLVYPKLKDYIKNIFVIAGVIQALLLIAQWVGVYFFKLDLATYSGRVVGTMGQPNFAASIIVVAYAILQFKRPSIYWIASTLCLISILVTGSLAELLTFIIIILIKFFSNFRNKDSKNFFIVGGSVLVVLLIFAGWREVDRKSFLLNPVESRINIWPQSAKLILNRPLVGYGAENIQFVFPDEYGGTSVDRAHNGLLDVLLVGGVFLGGVYVYLVFSGLKAGFGFSELTPFGLAFFALVLREQVGVNSIVNLVYFWLLLAILTNYNIKLVSPKE